MARKDGDFSFEITEHIGTISTSAKGWTKEVNRVSYNSGQPKIDIRDWSPDHAKMGKGITLFDDEARGLLDILQSMRL